MDYCQSAAPRASAVPPGAPGAVVSLAGGRAAIATGTRSTGQDDTVTLTDPGFFRRGWIARLWAFRLPVAPRPQPLVRGDGLVLAGLLLVAALAYVAAVAQWGDSTVRLSIGGRWFQSDGWRVFDDLTNFRANHYRDQVHPLFSLIGLAGTGVIRAVSGLDPLGAIRVFNGICFLAWCGLLYATARLAGCRMVDALLVLALAMLSAGSLFWFIVPETYVPGTVSILACLFVVALGNARDGSLVLAAAGSLSFTMTNWIAGLAAIGSSRSFGRGAIMAALSLALVIAGWGVGKAIFPQPGSLFLLPGTVAGESQFIADKEAGGPDDKAAGIFVSPMVAASLIDLTEQPTGPLLSIQESAVSDWTSGHPLFVAASALWLALLVGSLVLVARRRDPLAVALLLTLGGQTALHMVYGDETFLYALHFVPLYAVILGAGLAAHSPRLFRPVALVLLCLMAWNNLSRLDQAAHAPLTGTDARLDRLTAGWPTGPVPAR